MVQNGKVDRTTIKKTKLEEIGNDFAYWQTQPFEERLRTLEMIRAEFADWKYDTQQRFQRVYKVIKRQ